jgi:hypothetical protein
VDRPKVRAVRSRATSAIADGAEDIAVQSALYLNERQHNLISLRYVIRPPRPRNNT